MTKQRALTGLMCVITILISTTFSEAEVLTWDCQFVSRTDKQGSKPEKLRLIFKVDTISQKAFMEGNAGIVEVGLHIGTNAFSLTEKLGSGSIQTTTVTKDGIAVHSRNTVFLKQIIAAQHFGKCAFN